MVVEQQQDVLNQQDQLKFDGKYNAVKKELDEVISGKDQNEKLINKDVLNKNLDGEFGESLKKFPEKLQALQNGVDKIKNSPNLSQLAGDALKTLDQFLKDIQNKESVQDYSEFLKRLDDPKTLSRMNDNEIRRVKLYLQGNLKAALGVYPRMKNLKSNAGVYDNLKGDDKAYFDDVWNTLKDKYENSDDFMKFDYGELKSDASSLNKFLTENLNLQLQTEWDGRNIEAKDVRMNSRSLVSAECVARNFNKANQERNQKNVDYVLNNLEAPIGATDSAIVLSYLQFQILKFSKNNKLDLVNEREVTKILKENFGEIQKRLGIQIKQKQTNDTFGFADVDKVSGGSKTIFEAVQDLSKDSQFIDKGQDGNIRYYPDKAAAYLGKLNADGRDRSFFKNLSPKDGNRQAWIAAVQVLLNNIPEITKNDPLKVNGNLDQSNKSDPTLLRVMDFQRSKSSLFGDGKGRGFKVDGLPGQNTIKELIANQGGIAATERADRIQNGIPGLKVVDIDEFGTRTAFDYGINYVKDMKIFEDNNRENIYYRQGNDIFKISSDKPWEKSKASFVSDKVEWTLDESPNVCRAGSDRINEIIGSFTPKMENVSCIVDKGKYLIVDKKLGSTEIPGDLFKSENFCGVKNMNDRFKVVQLSNIVGSSLSSNSNSTFENVYNSMIYPNYQSLIPRDMDEKKFKEKFFPNNS